MTPTHADQTPVDDVLPVEQHVIPFDGADVLEQGGVDSLSLRTALAHDPLDLPSLPVDDAGQDEREAVVSGLSFIPRSDKTGARAWRGR